MLTNITDQHVPGYLGRALSLELSAVQLYSTQARLVDTWGLTEAAKKLGNEAHEEMAHADRIISRMLALGFAPNASQLRPVKLGHNLQSLLVHNHAFETELIGLYEQATRHCAATGDHDNRLFFEALLNDEKAHAKELQQWLMELQQPDING